MNSLSSSALEGVSLSSNVLFLVCLGLLASTSMPAYSSPASVTGASAEDEEEEDDDDSADDDMITTDKREKWPKKEEKKGRKAKRRRQIKG